MFLSFEVRKKIKYQCFLLQPMNNKVVYTQPYGS